MCTTSALFCPSCVWPFKKFIIRAELLCKYSCMSTSLLLVCPCTESQFYATLAIA